MDASCKIQGSIHSFFLVHNMCPELWVHIISGGDTIKDKCATYTVLAQQREIKEMTKGKTVWNKTTINKRHEKLVKFVVEEI